MPLTAEVFPDWKGTLLLGDCCVVSVHPLSKLLLDVAHMYHAPGYAFLQRIKETTLAESHEYVLCTWWLVFSRVMVVSMSMICHVLQILCVNVVWCRGRCSPEGWEVCCEQWSV